MNMVHPGLYSSLYQHSWKCNFYSFIYFSGQRTYERHNAFDWVSCQFGEAPSVFSKYHVQMCGTKYKKLQGSPLC